MNNLYIIDVVVVAVVVAVVGGGGGGGGVNGVVVNGVVVNGVVVNGVVIVSVVVVLFCFLCIFILQTNALWILSCTMCYHCLLIQLYSSSLETV